jgi:hypothetical protein
MEKVFKKLLETEEGKSLIFSILSLAMFYRHSVAKPHNPLVKSFGKETLTVQQVRKLLFQNVDEFEKLVTDLYTEHGENTFDINDLTLPSK